MRQAKLWIAAGVVAVLALAGGLTWALWPSTPAAPHATVYRDVSACLLTGPAGITAGSPAAPVWTAMHQASLSTKVMVSYLPATKADTTVMLNTLAERQCGVIITAGTATAPVLKAAQASPHQRYLLVGTVSGAAPSNTTVVSAAGAASQISHILHSLASSS